MDVLAGLDDEQRRAVQTDAGPLRILAGPGSGKTLVLSRRIARRVLDGSVDPRHVLALTFTRKAAGTLRDRLTAHGIRDLGPVGTFHAVALAQLRQWSADNGRRPPSVLGHRGRLMATVVKESKLVVPEAVLLREVDWARRRGLTPEGYAQRARDGGAHRDVDVDAVAVAYDMYERRKRRDGVFDLDDLISETTRLLRDDPTFRAAQRWRFRHLFVDEFQDMNRPQYALLRAWLGERTDLCVVGDPDQAIYGWNGGDPGLLTHLHQDLGEVTTVELRHNHRSSPAIVEAAGALLGRGPAACRQRPGPPVTVTAAADTDAEAEAVVSLLRNWQAADGAPGAGTRTDWSGFAVLARTNAQLPPIAAALDRAGVPNRMRGRHGDLGSPESRATIALLRAEGSGFAELVADLRAELDEPDGVAPIPSGAVPGTAPSEVVVRAAEQYLADHPRHTASGTGFVQWLRVLNEGDLAADGTAVDLLTFHSAKGLEWPVVVVTGCEEGYSPLPVVDPDALLEERRVFYVALTRAGRELHLTWSRSRVIGGITHRRQRSRFVDALAAVVDSDDAGPILPTDPRLEVRQMRVGLDDGEAASPEDAVRRRLLRWRSAQAAAGRVQPSAVLGDDAVARLAAATARGDVTTVDDVAVATGYGSARLNRFGESLLRACSPEPG